jgi:hypothetical protein
MKPLPAKGEAFSSNPSTAKKKTRKKFFRNDELSVFET